MADPLLLLPGLMCDARLWGPVQERLRVLVPDRNLYAGAHVAALRGARSAPDLAARLLRDRDAEARARTSFESLVRAARKPRRR